MELFVFLKNAAAKQKQELFSEQLDNDIHITGRGNSELIFFKNCLAICEELDDNLESVYEPQYLNGDKYKKIREYYYDEAAFNNFMLRKFTYKIDQKQNWLNLTLEFEDEYMDIKTEYFPALGIGLRSARRSRYISHKNNRTTRRAESCRRYYIESHCNCRDIERPECRDSRSS